MSALQYFCRPNTEPRASSHKTWPHALVPKNMNSIISFASGVGHSLLFLRTLAHSLGMSFVTVFQMSMCKDNNCNCTRDEILPFNSPAYSPEAAWNLSLVAHIVCGVPSQFDAPVPCGPLKVNPFHSSLSSSSPLVPLLQRWKQWTVEARKKLVIMATTDTEMPEKMIMSRSVRVRVAWHSRKLSFESWVRDTRLPSMGREHSMPSTPAP